MAEVAVVEVKSAADDKKAARLVEEFYKKFPSAKAEVAVVENDEYKVLKISAYGSVDKCIVLQVSAGVNASVFSIPEKHGGLETVKMDAFGGRVGYWHSALGIGVNAKVYLVDLSASIFDLSLALGISTGAGIKDDSLTVKWLGCGVTLGRKIEISVFDCSFGVDFGRLFG